jgi:cobalt-zinc-cadmium efflux system outer membrane protein
VKRTALLVILASIVAFGGVAFADGAPAPSRLGFGDYLAAVGRGNLDLAAQKAGVSVTEAQVAVARVFPDPQLTAGVAAVDISGTHTPTVSELSLQETIELGGKRGARVQAASHDLSSAQAGLEDFLRTLRGDASDAYIDAVAKRMVYERKQVTEASLQRLVAVNQERLRAGDIGEIALVQSRVEAGKSRGEVLAATTDMQQANLALALKLGQMRGGTTAVDPTGELHVAIRNFDLEPLIAKARENRADVRAKRYALSAAKARVALAHANRWIDLTVDVGWQHSFATHDPNAAVGPGNAVGGQLAYDTLGASLSVPLPFSHVYKGELTAASFNQTVAEWQLRGAELKVEVELRQAWSKYATAVARLKLYDSGLLKDADRVLEAKLYEYQRGGAPLLEVLEAQRTVNDVYLDYIDALAEHAHALVAIELAAGIWDVQL